MRSLKAAAGLEVDRMVGVYTGKRELVNDEMDVLPVEQFVQRLWSTMSGR